MEQIKLLEELEIAYIIKRGKYKRITIGYYHQQVLTIKCPKTLDINKLTFFIEKNIEWIKKHRPLKEYTEVFYTNNSWYLFLGKKYQIKLFSSKHPSVNIIGDKLVVYSQSDVLVKELIEKWRYEQAEFIFQEVLNKCFSEMSKYLEKYPHLEIKKYKSRWGCCYPNKNKIIINISVVNLPIELIEYVIFHELSHFIHMNHSSDFYSFLIKFVPNEKKLRKEIRKYNSFYE